MFRKLHKKKNGQNTAEYAILISMVVAAVIAMQTYVQRTLQAKIRDGAQFLASSTPTMGNSVQYEPYYLETSFNVTRDSAQTVRLDNGITGLFGVANIIRDDGGFQRFEYDTSAFTSLINGV